MLDTWIIWFTWAYRTAIVSVVYMLVWPISMLVYLIATYRFLCCFFFSLPFLVLHLLRFPILNFFIQCASGSNAAIIAWLYLETMCVCWSVIVCRCGSSSYVLNWAISTCIFTFDSQHDTWAAHTQRMQKKQRGKKRLHCLTCTTTWRTLINVKHNRKTTSTTTTTTSMMIKMQISS